MIPPIIQIDKCRDDDTAVGQQVQHAQHSVVVVSQILNLTANFVWCRAIASLPTRLPPRRLNCHWVNGLTLLEILFFRKFI